MHTGDLARRTRRDTSGKQVGKHTDSSGPVFIELYDIAVFKRRYGYRIAAWVFNGALDHLAVWRVRGLAVYLYLPIIDGLQFPACSSASDTLTDPSAFDVTSIPSPINASSKRAGNSGRMARTSSPVKPEKSGEM